MFLAYPDRQIASYGASVFFHRSQAMGRRLLPTKSQGTPSALQASGLQCQRASFRGPQLGRRCPATHASSQALSPAQWSPWALGHIAAPLADHAPGRQSSRRFREKGRASIRVVDCLLPVTQCGEWFYKVAQRPDRFRERAPDHGSLQHRANDPDSVPASRPQGRSSPRHQDGPDSVGQNYWLASKHAQRGHRGDTWPSRPQRCWPLGLSSPRASAVSPIELDGWLRPSSPSSSRANS